MKLHEVMGCLWWKSRFSSAKLLVFMVPIILVPLFIAHSLDYKFPVPAFPTLAAEEVVVPASPPLAAEEAVVSASPPLAAEEAVQIHSPVTCCLGAYETRVIVNIPYSTVSDRDTGFCPAVNEEILNLTTTRPHIFPLVNDSHVPPMSGTRHRKYSSLSKLEARLGRARAAIRNAKIGNQTIDPNYIPTGPIYRDAAAFQRSYLEMEKLFKVYVYEEGEHPIFHNAPCKSIYAMEGSFIHNMETSQFRTRDPNKAHVYFLPISVASMVDYIYEPNSHDWHPLKRMFRDYVNILAGKYPYWNRSVGADHFMLACHDWGPEVSKSVPELYKNSIRALCNANTSEGFKPSKDVSFPEILLSSGTLEGVIGGPSPSQRSILVFFSGGLHGPIRPILLEHWENKDKDVQVHKYLPKGVSYYGMLRQSKYCICASGYEVASPRMVEAIYTGCVPVLIKDHYVAPFSDVLNWKSFSVEIPVKEIPNMKKILTGISTRQYIRMQKRGQKVRRHFEASLPPKRYDVFHMILHSVWLRRLNIRVHDVVDL